MIGVIPLIANRRTGLDPIDEVVGESDVVTLPGRTDQAERKAERLGGDVDLGA
jgi:hypothetical protein